MNILLPKTITPEMLGAATNIPEVDASVGEVAWVSGTNYVVKDRMVHSGYVYECVKDITSAPQNTYAPSDVRSAGYWLIDKRNPTNRTAPFDKYPFTKARRTGSVVYQLTLSFVTGIAIYGIEGDTISVTVKDTSGNDLRPAVTSDLWEQAYGEREYLFGSLRRKTYFTLKNLPVHQSMKDVSELIYETCKAYLLQQGKFLLLLFAFIGSVIFVYFGFLNNTGGWGRVVIVLLFAINGLQWWSSRRGAS